MISDAAVRASIVPTVPRLSVYIHKFNYSHDMIYETGRFAMHLLHTKQFDLVRRLGFFSGRDQDKLAGIPHHNGKLGVPILDDCFAHFECSVVNVMDTGSSTLFFGDVCREGADHAAEAENGPGSRRHSSVDQDVAAYEPLHRVRHRDQWVR